MSAVLFAFCRNALPLGGVISTQACVTVDGLCQSKNSCKHLVSALATFATNENVVLPLYELIDAIKWNNVEAVESALDKQADPNGKDFSKLSMLQLAEKHHANRVVPLLLRHGADLYERIGKQEDLLLHRAVRNDNIGFVCALLEAGISPNLTNAIGESALHIAARTGQAYVARILIKSGAQPMLLDCKGRSPLDVAVAAEQTELIRMLKTYSYQSMYRGEYEDSHCSRPSLGSEQVTPLSTLQAVSECLSNRLVDHQHLESSPATTQASSSMSSHRR